MRLLSSGAIRRSINYWRPFLFSGIRVTAISHDWRQASAELRLHWWNRNAVGTMFGGSLFALTDPFYPLMIQHNLGPSYSVWMKSALVEFLSPGRTVAHASFLLSAERLDQIRAATEAGGKCEPVFSVAVSGPEGKAIARVTLTVYVRMRRKAPTEMGKVAEAVRQ